jgi:hypothetical protein
MMALRFAAVEVLRATELLCLYEEHNLWPGINLHWAKCAGLDM